MHLWKILKQAKSPSSFDSCVIVRMAKKKPTYTICKYVLPKWQIIKANGPISVLKFYWRINLFFGVLTVLSWLAYHSCSFGVSLRCTSVSLVSRPYKASHCCILGVSFRCTPWGYRPTFYRFTWVHWSFFPGILLHAPPSRKFPLRVGPWGARYLTRFLWCLQTAVKYACNQVSFIKTLRQCRSYEWRILLTVSDHMYSEYVNTK